jgi:hypothetical protein
MVAVALQWNEQPARIHDRIIKKANPPSKKLNVNALNVKKIIPAPDRFVVNSNKKGGNTLLNPVFQPLPLVGAVRFELTTP